MVIVVELIKLKRNTTSFSITKEVALDDRSFESLAKGLSTVLKQGIEEVSVNIARAIDK